MTSVHELPAGSRVWVFTASRALTADDVTRLSEILDRVFGVWTKKSPGVRSVFEFRDARFLVVGADEREACVSGCGIDAMMQWMKQIGAETGFQLVDRMQVFWRGTDGAVRSAHRTEFQRLLLSGEVTAQTRVFDTAAATSDVFRDGRFELPFGESWHARIFPAVAAS